MALEDAGYHVIPVTRRQLEEEPYVVIAHIARALERYARTPGWPWKVYVSTSRITLCSGHKKSAT